VIQAEEAAKLYVMRKSQVQGTDYEVHTKDWFHLADTESLNSMNIKKSTPYKYSQTAAKASMGWEPV
jgi:hypothetical protein